MEMEHDHDVQVCRSAAGWYIGRFCFLCGPISRESGYFCSAEEAEAILRLEYKI